MPCSRRKKVELWNIQKQNYKITLQKNKCKSLLNPEVYLFSQASFLSMFPKESPHEREVTPKS